MITAVMGWMGTAGSLAAYLLLSHGKWHATSLRYSALNALAGALAATASAVYGAWPSVGANVLWALIASHVGLTTLRERRVRRLVAVDRLPSPDHDTDPPTGPQPSLVAA